MSVFRSKAVSLQQKRLLVMEQPLEKIEKTTDCSPYEIIIEPLAALLNVFSKIKIGDNRKPIGASGLEDKFHC
jgi:hypothetical protein